MKDVLKLIGTGLVILLVLGAVAAFFILEVLKGLAH